MLTALGFVAMIFQAACSVAPRYESFPEQGGPTYVVVDRHGLRQACVSKASVWDDGSLIMNGQYPVGCYKSLNDEVWLLWSPELETVLHELEHRENHFRRAHGKEAVNRLGTYGR